MLNKILNKFGYELTKLEKVKEEPQIETPLPDCIKKHEQILNDLRLKQQEVTNLIYKRTELEGQLKNNIKLIYDARDAGTEIEYLFKRSRLLDIELTELNFNILKAEDELKEIESNFKLVEKEVKEAGWSYDWYAARYDPKNGWVKR